MPGFGRTGNHNSRVADRFRKPGCILIPLVRASVEILVISGAPEGIGPAAWPTSDCNTGVVPVIKNVRSARTGDAEASQWAPSPGGPGWLTGGNRVDKKRSSSGQKNYLPFFFCSCRTIRAWIPKYWETPIAWHWSMDALSKETRSAEYIAQGEFLPRTRTLPL
jgi:hypothetical protein